MVRDILVTLVYYMLLGNTFLAKNIVLFIDDTTKVFTTPGVNLALASV